MRLAKSWILRFAMASLLAAGCFVLGPTASRGAEPAADVEAEAECDYHGTAVRFVSSPAAAARLAKLDEKLVLVLHVSGNFETPDFT